MRAYVDESVRVTGNSLYALAGMIVPEAARQDVREQLLGMLPPK